jgi:hypothetical protein
MTKHVSLQIDETGSVTSVGKPKQRAVIADERKAELRGLEPREPMTHELKCWPEYYAAIERGEKTFEVRKWDRPYRIGDTLLLKEYNQVKNAHTGRETARRITYVLDMTYLPGDNVPHFAGYCVMGLESQQLVRLTAQLAAMTRERDAAVADLETLDDNCEVCEHYYNATCIDTVEEKGAGQCFTWRGVQPKGETE